MTRNIKTIDMLRYGMEHITLCVESDVIKKLMGAHPGFIFLVNQLKQKNVSKPYFYFYLGFTTVVD